MKPIMVWVKLQNHRFSEIHTTTPSYRFTTLQHHLDGCCTTWESIGVLHEGRTHITVHPTHFDEQLNPSRQPIQQATVDFLLSEDDFLVHVESEFIYSLPELIAAANE